MDFDTSVPYCHRVEGQIEPDVGIQALLVALFGKSGPIELYCAVKASDKRRGEWCASCMAKRPGRASIGPGMGLEEGQGHE